jgi:hypothetical protein
VAQNYWGVENYPPTWVIEGLADYGRNKFGLYNAKADWSVAKYSAEQKYTDSYTITTAFFIWLEKNIDPQLMKDLNKTIKEGRYGDDYFKKRTGKTVDELWKMYAEANN